MLKEGYFYHIYNRGINSQDLFFAEKDYNRFLYRYKYYLGLSLQTVAYCLMKNHIHFLIRILSNEEKLQMLNTGKRYNTELDSYVYPNPNNKQFKVEKLLGHLFNSHTKYINLKYDRTGPLWEGNFKAKEIDSDAYLQHCICYIHRNPIHHGLSKSYKAYSFSSYNEILSNRSQIVDSNNTLKIFGGSDNYVAAHNEINIYLNPEYRLEKI